MFPLFALALLFVMVALSWLSGLFGRVEGSPPPQERSMSMYDRSLAQTEAHTESLIADLVHWVNTMPRSYGETMTAWRTSCPRLTIWEDALDRGYVRRLPREAGPAQVVATDAGRTFLASRPAA
jgi:hypothetical protein